MIGQRGKEGKDKEERGREKGLPSFMPIHQSGEDVMDVGACADEEKDDQEERLEVEEC